MKNKEELIYTGAAIIMFSGLLIGGVIHSFHRHDEKLQAEKENSALVQKVKIDSERYTPEQSVKIESEDFDGNGIKDTRYFTEDGTNNIIVYAHIDKRTGKLYVDNKPEIKKPTHITVYNGLRDVLEGNVPSDNSYTSHSLERNEGRGR